MKLFKMKTNALVGLLACITPLDALQTAFLPKSDRQFQVIQNKQNGSLKSSHFDTETTRAANSPDNGAKILASLFKPFGALVVASVISFGSLTSFPSDATASDGAAIGLCLLKQCRVELAKCITNPNCLANVICINSCNGKEDETGCQIKCGDQFENEVVGEFNKCAVSDRSCVPKRQDDGSYPVPDKSKTVEKFDTSLWNGRWYISAGQNELFDIFPCQVHFFTETAPGKFFGKLNWRVLEPDGEFFTRDALQRFVQDPQWPAHLINHDNEYLHYQDDWYVLDYERDDNPDGVPPFCFVYYRGSNDAWDGYGGAFVYTRDSKLPESIKPRLREAAKKVNFDFDKDFTETDNSCGTLDKNEVILKREQFAGKILIQTEEQFAQQAVLARNTAVNSIKAQKLFFDNELDQAEKAFETLGKSVITFEDEAIKTITGAAKK